MSYRLIHFSCRVLVLAALLWPLAAVGGCAMFRKETWSIERFRDERAADIDHRLEHNRPSVKNPF